MTIIHTSVMDAPGGLSTPAPDIQGFNGTNAIQYLKTQYQSGSVSNGTATVYLTDDTTATGTPMFSAVHHVSVTTYSTDADTFTSVQSLSSDLKTLTFDVLQYTSIGGVVKISGTLTYTVAAFGEP